MRAPRIPRPDRIRRIGGGFGWVDHRLLKEGHLVKLTPTEMALYLFLILVANRDGVSYYHLETINKRLGYIGIREIALARKALVAADLIAFRPFSTHDPNGFYQVLSLEAVESSHER